MLLHTHENNEIIVFLKVTKVTYIRISYYMKTCGVVVVITSRSLFTHVHLNI